MNADTDGDWAEAYALQACHMLYRGRSKSLKVTDSLLLLKLALAMSLALPYGCATPDVIPAELLDRVDRAVSFVQVKEAPASYQGHLIVVGGVVLSAKLLKEGTRIEILQLPLGSSQEPGIKLTTSQGRFMAYKKDFLDPATLPVGTRVTVVGEVTGAITLPVDETEYTFPTLEIKKLTVWPKMVPSYWFRPYPYFGAYWGSYWGPYWGPPLGLRP